MAFDAGTIVSVINDIGGFVLSIINILLGTTGSPMSTVIFAYILPGVLMFFILYDFIYLMGFFRKTTAMWIAIIFSLFGARFGVYWQVVQMLQTFLGSSATGSGVWIPMLTLIFILMAFWWTIGHFLWGFRFAQDINKAGMEIDSGLTYLDNIGSFLGSDAPSKSQFKDIKMFEK